MFKVVDLENSASMSAGIPNRLYSSLCHPNTFLSPLFWSLLPTQHPCNMPKSRHPEKPIRKGAKLYGRVKKPGFSTSEKVEGL